MAQTVTQHQLLIFLVVFSNLGSVSAEISIRPDIVEASVGETVSFNCTEDLNTVIPNIEWHHIGVDRLHDLICKEGYIYSKYKNRCNVSCGIDHCNLIINNVTMDDAGRFICMQFDDVTSQKEAKLIVLARFPSDRFCSVSMKFPPTYHAEVSCQMEYRGNIATSMEWIDSGGNSVNSTTSTIYGITTSAMQLTRDQIKNSYSCQIQYIENVSISRFKWGYSYELLGYMLQSEECKNTRSIHTFIAVVTCSLGLCVILSSIIIWMRIAQGKKTTKSQGLFQRRNYATEYFREEQQISRNALHMF